MKNVLLLKAGEASNVVRSLVGDYDRWFLESAWPKARFQVVQACLGQKLPPPKGYDAIWMTGSPLSVTSRSEWMRRTQDYLKESFELRVPYLGICFGHQLLAEAFGGRVNQSPLGREIGTIVVELTDQGKDDELFKGLPDRFEAQTTHEDTVTLLPQDAVVLASNRHSPVQAMRIGRWARGVQFHPELSSAGMRAVIHARADRLEAEAARYGFGRNERVGRLLAGVGFTPLASRVLSNFLTYLC